MNLLRKILFPFAILYGWITSFRNLLFDRGVLKSSRFNVPIIAVGNLSVGGTGKSPQIEYLIRLLSDQYKVATLSRGYKRKSEGFVLANENVNALTIGDEPYQFYQKFKNIQVAVDANRKNGIEQLLSQSNPPGIILLDDAFQHRKVKAGFYILLTTYDDLYSKDYMLPTGNLRENRKWAKRANVIIITKCPSDLSVVAQDVVKKQLNPTFNQKLFFTFINYEDFIYSKNKTIALKKIMNEPKFLIAGIANPASFFNYLKKSNDTCLAFSDHHHFSENEILDIKNKAGKKIIITTEKDYVRLKDSILADQLYYLPIKSTFISGGADFDKKIINYVGTSTRNG